MKRRQLLLTLPFIVLYLLITLKPLAAQNDSKLDSLKTVLETAVDTSRVALLVQLCYYSFGIDSEAAMTYAQEGQDLARKLDYAFGIGESTYALGYCYHLQDQYQVAEERYQEALQIFKDLGKEKNSAEAYNRLGQIYTIKADYHKSLDFYAQALEISRRLKDNYNAGTIIFGMANNYSYLGESAKAFELLKESKQIITYKPHLINYYAILGDLYRSSGSLKKGLESFYQSIELCEELGDELRMAYVYHAIGNTYLELGNYEKSADAYFKVIELNKQLESTTLEMVCYEGLGELYLFWKEYDKSLTYFQKGLDLAEKNQINEKIPKCLVGIGTAYAKKKAYYDALTYFEEALDYASKIKIHDVLIDCYLYIGDMQMELGNYEKSLEFLSQGLVEAKAEESTRDHSYFSLQRKIGEVYLKQGKYQKSIAALEAGLKFDPNDENRIEREQYYKNLSEAYQHTHNHQQSLQYFKSYSAIRDSLLDEENSKQLASMRTKYETEEKEKEIVMLQKEKEIQSLSLAKQEAEISKQKAYLSSLALFLFIGGLVFWNFFNRYKLQKQMEQLRLEQKNMEVSQQLKMAELRTHFFTNISHEFRTPLTLLLTPLQDLLANAKGELKSTYQLMNRNAHRLLDLVNQTMDLTKMESGHLPLHRELCYPGRFIQEIVDGFVPLAEVKQVQLQWVDQCQHQKINIDKNKMEKAISNLLSNAFEHTDADGKISLRISNEMEGEQAFFIVEVKDTGKGIPAEHLPFIFDRYYQVDKKNLRGTGIGLALTKEIIDLHKGEIKALNTDNQGITFSLKIPIDATPSSSQALPQSTAPSAFQFNTHKKVSLIGSQTQENGSAEPSPFPAKKALPKVLIVEDHEEVINYISQLLSKNYSILRASNGKEAMQCALKQQPELIISDVMMPVMDGFELTAQLKSQITTSHIPVILLTARASKTSQLAGLKYGADAYLTKPFYTEELMIRCHNLIKQRRLLRQRFGIDPSLPVKQVTSNVLDEEFLSKALAIVHRHLDNSEFNVDKFCQEIGMSRTNLYTKLKALTGQNISDFIRTLRLQKAAELIETNSGNIIEIATMVGFNTRQSFNKSFKDRFGLTPTEYRKCKL